MFILNNRKFEKKFGEHLTPVNLVDEMLGKIPVEEWKNKDGKWCDPFCGIGSFLLGVKEKLMEGLSDEIPNNEDREKWILEHMIYGQDIQAKNIKLCSLRLDPHCKYSLNLEIGDSLKGEIFMGKKFDVIVGNPPYQAPTENKGVGHTLWDKFAEKCINELVKDDGYVCLVHPCGWRRVSGKYVELGKKMRKLKIEYLEIHDINDGQKVFGVCTRYDWYVLKNQKNTDGSKTIIWKQDHYN
jgi:hypothetical protein